ncbi:MAG: peptidoglycan-associated lipoprotein [Betaproteobacteria bacterium]|jgi:peptidoglycan-associated lipoprotein|nr:peptidoglycan-associated lipoprotein [Betaproteobacteria bacterium]
MKRWMIMFAVVGLLAGCSSTATKEQEGAKVIEATPSVAEQPKPPTTKPQTDTTTKPLSGDGTAGMDPLKDPNSPLSRRSVFFDYDSNAVKDEYKPLVSEHAKYLSSNRAKKVTIQGNTDERGSREYNIALGQRRADAVKQMMTLLGAPATQIETVSFGEEKPRGQGNSEQAYAENRRADIVYQGE